jgi:AraC-like DNA-binding protein
METAPRASFEKSEWAVLQKELCTAAFGRAVSTVLRELRSRSGILSEEEAARLSDLSASRFRHQFKETVGTSFREARLHVKLSQAALLLRNTGLSIPDISEMLQYTDRTKLEKAFKRFYGITPTEYRHESTC